MFSPKTTNTINFLLFIGWFAFLLGLAVSKPRLLLVIGMCPLSIVMSVVFLSLGQAVVPILTFSLGLCAATEFTSTLRITYVEEVSFFAMSIDLLLLGVPSVFYWTLPENLCLGILGVLVQMSKMGGENGTDGENRAGVVSCIDR